VAFGNKDTENGGMAGAKKKLEVVNQRHTQALEIERLGNELAAERAARLALEEKFDKLLEGFRATERMYQKRINELEVENRDLREKLESAEKTIAWLRKEKFGSKDEPLPEGSVVELEFNEPGSSLCNEPGVKEASEPEAAKSNEPKCLKHNEPGARAANEPKATGLPKGQRPGAPGHGRTNRDGVPVSETQELKIPGGCFCGKCGKEYLVLPETDNSELAEIMIWVHRVLYERRRYAPQCACEGNKIESAPPPPRLYPRTTIGNSLWLHLVVQKYLHGIPTNRTIKALSLAGLPLAHGTIVGGFKVIDGLLTPLYEAVLEHCQGGSLWNADETTWRVFDADKINWWLWLIASTDSVVYILDQSRSKTVPQEFFGGAVGTLMTDRLSSYKSLEEAIKKAWCWIHQRRDIYKLFVGVPLLKNWAQDWLVEIARLFVIEDERFSLWKQGRTTGSAWETAQKRLEEHIQSLKERWETELKLPKLHKLQKQALRSMKRHWDGLTVFVSDPRVPLHNNRAERLIRNAVILRKNSFGSGTEWAGNLTAKLLTLFQTWLVNDLNPEDLLLDYFNTCSQTPGKPPPDINSFLPWSMSEERKKQFSLPRGYQKPG